MNRRTEDPSCTYTNNSAAHFFVLLRSKNTAGVKGDWSEMIQLGGHEVS